MREGGGNCVKDLKRGWNRKEERGNKKFKKRGQAESRGECLKKGGWNHLKNYAWSRSKGIYIIWESIYNIWSNLLIKKC